MKHLPLYGVFLTVAIALSSSSAMHAQCTIACNDQVNVSIPPAGFAIVLPDMILEGEETNCPGPKEVQVMIPPGLSIGDTVTCELVGDLLNVMVIDVATGNFCWGTILVEDKLPPVVTCRDTIVNCTADLDPDSIGLFAIFDNCDANPDTNFIDVVEEQACSTLYTQRITRTWYVTDDSGNVSDPCVQTFLLRRPLLSEVEFPGDFGGSQIPALSCEDPDTSVANTGFPMVDSLPADQLCKINVVYEDQVIEGCELSFTVLREWTVLECCSGEIITHTQVIKVMDMEPPVFTCPDTLTFGANGPNCTGFFMLPALPVTDNCSSEISVRTITPSGMIEGNGGLSFGLPMGTHIVRYEALDNCGNQSVCEIPIGIVDNVAPVAVCDEITKVALTNQGIASVPASVFDDGSYDGCCTVDFFARRMDEPDAPFTPDVLFDCEDLGDTIMVIVEVRDCDSNSNTCMVEVIPEDKLPPEITCPPDITLVCTEWLPAPPSLTGEPVVFENCMVDTLFFTDNENLDVCNTGTITRTFTVFDLNGFGDFCTQTITLIDTTVSQFFFPADTVLDCSVPVDSISAGEAFAISDCELYGLNISDEVFPIECGLKIFRTYTFLDWCSGMDTSYTQFIKLEDTNPPVWDQPLGSLDTAYVCPGDLQKPPPPTATDFCTPVTVVQVSDDTIFMGCPNRFTRTVTYSAVDTCGNEADPFVVMLMVNDTVPPGANLPDQGPFECGTPMPPFVADSIDAFDNCPIGGVLVELIGETMPDSSCMDTVIRTYRLVDTCGNEALVTQNFLFFDTTPPTADPDTLGPFACLANIPDPAPEDIVATDLCSDNLFVELDTIIFVDSTDCTGEVIHRFRLRDDCGNDTLVSQVLLIRDTIAPIISCIQPDTIRLGILDCERMVSVSVGASDNCLVPPTITNDYNGGGNTVTDIFGIGTEIITFFAEDACGNISSCADTIVILDVIKPAVSCGNFDLYLNNEGLAFLDSAMLVDQGVISSMDSCSGNLTFEIIPGMVDCTDWLFEPTPLDYTLNVTDEYGNTGSCTTSFFLHDTLDICDDDPLIVNGRVFLEDLTAVIDFEVQLQDDQNMSTDLTEDFGLYYFENMNPGATCSVKPYKNDDLLNGVTTFDLVMITKHVLGTQLLNSPYRMIAADINNSGAITTFDVALLRKAILQISSEFPGNTSWRFIRANYDFPDPSDPFMETLPEEEWIVNMQYDAAGRNFVAVKIGDVNGTAQVDFNGGSIVDRNAEILTLTAIDQAMRSGESAMIPVYAESMAELAALQATIEYDATAMTFEGISGGALDIGDAHFAQPESGVVTLAWDNPDGIYFTPEAHLFYLKFQITSPVTLHEALEINSMTTPAIAYDYGGNPLNIAWRIHEVTHTPVDVAEVFLLGQNKPNPFSNDTRIVFLLRERMPVNLEIVDLSGRRISTLDETLEAGWHEVTVSAGELSGNGLYIYQLITPFGTQQRKMVVSAN